MNEDRIIRNLRNMAWERAKGELRSMLHTFWDDNPKYKELDAAMTEFIKRVEDEGLFE